MLTFDLVGKRLYLFSEKVFVIVYANYSNFFVIICFMYHKLIFLSSHMLLLKSVIRIIHFFIGSNNMFSSLVQKMFFLVVGFASLLVVS